MIIGKEKKVKKIKNGKNLKIFLGWFRKINNWNNSMKNI